MATDSLDDRRKALEEQFFQQHEKELVQKLKDAAAKETSRDELQKLTGITDTAVLDALANLKIGGAATLVMSLYPVIEVAWADGSIDAKEKAAIMEASKSIGLEKDTPAYAFLDKWIAEKPELVWHKLWADYVQALVKNMKPDDKALLKATVLGRALTVAEASGGFLGVAFRVSAAEKQAMAKLEQAFA
jgi:tellurite resistance protein